MYSRLIRSKLFLIKLIAHKYCLTLNVINLRRIFLAFPWNLRVLYRLATSQQVSNCSLSCVHEQLFPEMSPRRVSCLDVKQFSPSQWSAQGHLSLRLHSRATYQHQRTTASSPPLLTAFSSLAFIMSPYSSMVLWWCAVLQKEWKFVDVWKLDHDVNMVYTLYKKLGEFCSILSLFIL